jgi:hypothetical protein
MTTLKKPKGLAARFKHGDSMEKLAWDLWFATPKDLRPWRRAGADYRRRVEAAIRRSLRRVVGRER